MWRGKEQDPKTQAAVRDVDLPKELAALLSEFVGDRKEGFLFRSASSYLEVRPREPWGPFPLQPLPGSGVEDTKR